MHHRKLKEIVSGQVLLHMPGDSDVVSATKLMAARNVAAILVIDAGELRGIFTERDLLRRVVAAGRDPGVTTLSDVMSADMISLDAERLGFEAVALMNEFGVRHVVVTGVPGNDYGIVSIRDFAHSELVTFEKQIEFEQRLWSSI